MVRCRPAWRYAEAEACGLFRLYGARVENDGSSLSTYKGALIPFCIDTLTDPLPQASESGPSFSLPTSLIHTCRPSTTQMRPQQTPHRCHLPPDYSPGSTNVRISLMDLFAVLPSLNVVRDSYTIRTSQFNLCLPIASSPESGTRQYAHLFTFSDHSDPRSTVTVGSSYPTTSRGPLPHMWYPQVILLYFLV